MITNTQPVNAEELSAAEKRKAYSKAYREANKEKLNAHQKAYRKTNKERLNAQQKACREANKEQHHTYYRAYREANKQEIYAYNKARREAKKEEINTYERAYYRANREKIRAHINTRRQTDELYRMKCDLRTSIYVAFKRIQMNKPADTETLLGCSWQEAKEHFEKLFEPGMTWMNHGEWHIDHIVPIATAQTIEEAVKLNRISNLQPLWARDNLTKGSSVEG